MHDGTSVSYGMENMKDRKRLPLTEQSTEIADAFWLGVLRHGGVWTVVVPICSIHLVQAGSLNCIITHGMAVNSDSAQMMITILVLPLSRHSAQSISNKIL